jgi:Zn-dependent protease with chaperone function
MVPCQSLSKLLLRKCKANKGGKNMLYREYRLTSFSEYIAQQDRGKMIHGEAEPSYAHPVDKSIINILNSTRVKAVLTKAYDAYISMAMGRELADAVNIDQKSFPDLFEIVSHCARTLTIPTPHAVVVHREGSLFDAYTAGTDDYAFIVMSPTLCHVMSKEEVRFVVGHECGHIASSHMMYHFLVGMLTQAIVTGISPFDALVWALSNIAGVNIAAVPLMAWSRRSEITADRAGLLCCGDIAVAERALLRLVLGLADPKEVDIEHYLRGTEEAEQRRNLGSLQELSATHPLIPKRIKALRLFARSELYYKLMGKARPAGQQLLTREELNRRVELIVKP